MPPWGFSALPHLPIPPLPYPHPLFTLPFVFHLFFIMSFPSYFLLFVLTHFLLFFHLFYHAFWHVPLTIIPTFISFPSSCCPFLSSSLTCSGLSWGFASFSTAFFFLVTVVSVSDIFLTPLLMVFPISFMCYFRNDKIFFAMNSRNETMLSVDTFTPALQISSSETLSWTHCLNTSLFILPMKLNKSPLSPSNDSFCGVLSLLVFYEGHPCTWSKTFFISITDDLVVHLRNGHFRRVLCVFHEFFHCCVVSCEMKGKGSIWEPFPIPKLSKDILILHSISDISASELIDIIKSGNRLSKHCNSCVDTITELHRFRSMWGDVHMIRNSNDFQVSLGMTLFPYPNGNGNIGQHIFYNNRCVAITTTLQLLQHGKTMSPTEHNYIVHQDLTIDCKLFFFLHTYRDTTSWLLESMMDNVILQHLAMQGPDISQGKLRFLHHVYVYEFTVFLLH